MVEGSDKVSCAPVDDATWRAHLGVEVPMPIAVLLVSNTKFEFEANVSATVVYSTVFVPPKVEAPVPPFVTERSVVRVRALKVGEAVVFTD